MTKAEKDRMMLLHVTRGNPQAIMVVLDTLKEQAREALHSTLATAEPSVLKELDKRIDQTFRKYEQTVQKVLKTLSDDFLSKLSSLTETNFKKEKEALIKSMKSDSQFKGPKGDRPSEKELRDLIKLLTPPAIPGPKP